MREMPRVFVEQSERPRTPPFAKGLTSLAKNRDFRVERSGHPWRRPERGRRRQRCARWRPVGKGSRRSSRLRARRLPEMTREAGSRGRRRGRRVPAPSATAPSATASSATQEREPPAPRARVTPRPCLFPTARRAWRGTRARRPRPKRSRRPRTPGPSPRAQRAHRAPISPRMWTSHLRRSTRAPLAWRQRQPWRLQPWRLPPQRLCPPRRGRVRPRARGPRQLR